MAISFPYKTLPAGVYAVSTQFRDASVFRFQGVYYTVRPGENAFTSLEELVTHPLEAVESPFLGYENVPVILIPSGILPIGEVGKTNQERFRVYFPRTVAILGENAGLDANHHEAMDEVNDQRRDESVIQGSFYFGAIHLAGQMDGEMTLDGLTIGCRVHDMRTGGKDVSLVIKNSIISANISGHIVQVAAFEGQRKTHVFDSRCTDILSMNGEGNIFFVDGGEFHMEDSFVGRTDKIFGMSNYAGTRPTHATKIHLEWVMFEAGLGDRCLTFCVPFDDQLVLIDQCRFSSAVLDRKPPIRINRSGNNMVTLNRNEFYDAVPTHMAVVQRDLDRIYFHDNVFSGGGPYIPQYAQVVSEKRRTKVRKRGACPVTDRHTALQDADFAPLDKLYAGRNCYHGDFHCHSNSGGTSDGQTPLADYVPGMDKLDMDFAAIVDHRQMRHFFLPEWDENRLICGTEPGCMLSDGDRPWYNRKMDYTMIFPDKTGLAKVMEAFPQFKYTGGTEGTYVYVPHTRQQLRELGEFIYGIGGLLSHAHPKQLMVSDDPLDYYFGDHVAIETIHGHPSNYATRLNHQLWVALLQLGKRVRTHGSSDSHGPVSNQGLTTVYAPRRHSRDIFNLVRAGDCTAGAVGIQMSIDDAPMGSVTPYAPHKVLLVRVGDFHRDHRPADTVYSLRVYTDRGLAWVKEFAGEDISVALPVKPRQFYRVEIYNESDSHIVALSNPIWLADGVR